MPNGPGNGDGRQRADEKRTDDRHHDEPQAEATEPTEPSQDTTRRTSEYNRFLGWMRHRAAAARAGVPLCRFCGAPMLDGMPVGVVFAPVVLRGHGVVEPVAYVLHQPCADRAWQHLKVFDEGPRPGSDPREAAS
jgi:hypothetical protein